MSKILFVVPPFTGHINPTLSLGKTLIERGWEVAWAGITDSFVDQLPDKGTFLLIESENDTISGEAYFQQIAAKGQQAFGIESIKFLYQDVLIPLSHHMYVGLNQIVSEYKPNVIVTDHQVYAGAIVAKQHGIPYVTSVTAPTAIKAMADLPKIQEWETEQIVALQQQLGIKEEQSLACSKDLTLVFTSKPFLNNMPFPENYKFVGPVIQGRPMVSAFNWDLFHNTSKPRILVSIGTTFDHSFKKGFFSKVIEAFENSPMTVVVVADPELFEQWPDNFIVQSKVPQLELLPHLDAVVCHGGYNTVCESLSNGLPLVTLPIAYDQSHVAAQVVEIGCGVRLKFKRFKAIQLRTAINEVLENPVYRKAALQMKKSFASAGGTSTAVDHIEALTNITTV